MSVSLILFFSRNTYLATFYLVYIINTVISHRLYPNNVLGIRAFADTLACWTLVEACNRYLQKHFVDVSMADEFLNLPLPDVRDIISRDELNVQSEENVSVRDAVWSMCVCI